MNRNRLELLTLGFLVLFTMGSSAIVALLAVGSVVGFALIAACTLAFFLFSLLHASLTIGGRHTLVFLTISFVVSVVFELLGTSRGWIYGAYHYTDSLGPKILDLVPVLIPLAWFMMIYASYTLANLLAGENVGSGRRLGRLLWLVVLSAFIMTSWDLMNDPINVAGGHWVWANSGSYFGIPLSNYWGWLLTTLLVFLLYRLYEHWRTPPLQPALRASFPILPVLAYAVTMLANVGALAFTGQPAVAMIGLFSMGAFLTAALSLGMRSGALGGNNGT